MSKDLTEDSLLEAAEARIARLEGALQQARLPNMDSHCECCNQLYVMTSWESVRCFRCTHTCCKPKGSKVWVQGDQCPTKKCYEKK